MISVPIETIAAGGDGVGHLPDGRAVFVPRTAPGDTTEIEITEEKSRYARARIREISLASALRVTPECPHYVIDRCGGCQLQHLSADAQRDAKGRIVQDALRRIGGMTVEQPAVTPSSAGWRYRTKITLAVRGQVIGLHQEGNPDEVFPLVDCLITQQALMDVWGMLRGQRHLLPAGLTSLVLRQDRDGGLHVIAVAGTEPWDAAPLRAVLGDGISVWWHPEGGAARVVAGPRTGFPATAFAQMNPPLAERIRSDAVAALGDIEGRVVWDLYGGVGDTARLLAAHGAKVWSIDADRSAIDWAKNAGGTITYQSARVEDAIQKLPRPHAIVVNPPRTGLHERVTAQLARWEGDHGKLVYISCDPATLARDLKRLPALQVSVLTAYDLFPQTAHVETVVVLEAR